MAHYKNKGGDSGVSDYGIGSDHIIVEFNDGSQYLYNYAVTGEDNVERMKILAVEGEGLNTFINANVTEKFAGKLR